MDIFISKVIDKIPSFKHEHFYLLLIYSYYLPKNGIF